jgi:O-antigen/teichoic acid export membrane protein
VASGALIVLLLGQVINVISGPVGVILKMTHYQNALFLMILISIITNLVLNVIWIPKFGILGAASATAISIVIFNLLAIIFIRRKLNFYSFIPKIQ